MRLLLARAPGSGTNDEQANNAAFVRILATVSCLALTPYTPNAVSLLKVNESTQLNSTQLYSDSSPMPLFSQA